MKTTECINSEGFSGVGGSSSNIHRAGGGIDEGGSGAISSDDWPSVISNGFTGA